MRAPPSSRCSLLAGCGDGDRPAAPPPAARRSSHARRPRRRRLPRGRPGRAADRPRRPRAAGRRSRPSAQLTDTHVRDEESPARVPFLDRIGAPFTSTFRPQEAFSAQMLDAAVRALNRERPQAVFVTGDITDNAQRNELDTRLAHPQAAATPTPTAAPRATAACRRPTRPTPSTTAPTTTPHPPRRARARAATVHRAGLDAPWYALVGNHDVLVQGEVPPTPEIDAIATGDRLVPSLDPELLEPARATRRPRSWPSTTCSRASPARQRRGPRRPGRAGSSRPARPSGDSGTPNGLHGRPRPERPSDPRRHRQPRRHLAGAHHPRPARAAAHSSSAHRSLGRRVLPQPADPTRRSRCSISTPTSSPRSPATRTRTASTPAAATG